MKFEVPKFETNRLILTWPSYEQIEQYYLDIKGSSMFETIQWDGPSSSDDLHSYWKDCTGIDPCDPKCDLHIAIIDKEKNKYVGGAALRPINENPCFIDVGYALAPKYHGKGYATETMKFLVDHAFENRKAERIIANIFVGNTASRKVTDKLGFQLEGVQRRALRKNQKWLDEWLMSIIRPDWKK